MIQNNCESKPKKQDFLVIPEDLDQYRYITIQMRRGAPVSADEARHILHCIGVSEANINALNWDEYKEVEHE